MEGNAEKKKTAIMINTPAAKRKCFKKITSRKKIFCEWENNITFRVFAVFYELYALSFLASMMDSVKLSTLLLCVLRLLRLFCLRLYLAVLPAQSLAVLRG